MSRLSLYLLGSPRIERDGEPIQVDTRKAIALLAYIAISGESHRRDALVNLLWPEYDQTRGRTVLRRTLYALRKALAGDWLDVDRENVGLNPHVELWLDVDQFHGYLDACQMHGHPTPEVCPACLAPLAAAVELYRGDFMSGFTLKDSFNFDDWQFFQAESLRREFAGALERLVRCHVAQGAFEPAIRHARRWLALDRLDESAHCQLMLLYAWSGQRPAALRQYQECVRILQSQLGAAPQASTTELHKAIAAGRVPEPPHDGRFQHPEEGIGAQVGPQPGPLISLGGQWSSVPAPASPFVGEAKRLVTLLSVDVSRSFARGKNAGPEEEAALVDGLRSVMQDALARYGGQIERTLGGNILAVLGTAQTHESDPELAIRAALEMRTEAGELGANIGIGINTGVVYLRRREPDRERGSALVGRAVDLAVRLAGQAPAGQILVGESTYHLTRRAFAFTPRALAMAGTDEPVRAYQVERLLPRPRKARGIEGLRAELVGRDEELARLNEALAQVLQGRGRMVSLIGEAGVGKSRLIAELRQAALAHGEDGPVPLWLEGRCLELGTATSYAPFLDMVRTLFGWGAREADRRRYERVVSSLQGMVERGDLAQERAAEMAAFFAHRRRMGRAAGEGRSTADPVADVYGRSRFLDRPLQKAACRIGL
jgi:DNA-binding SARP family transcriptional activator/class 3 adenylate cyclase